MFIRSCVLAVALSSSASWLTAITAVSNSGQFFETFTTVGKTFDFDFQQAISFTTGPVTTQLSKVTLHGNSVNNLADFTVALCTGISSSGPLTPLAVILNSVTPESSVILAPNTRYWLVASAPNTELGSSFAWKSIASLDEDAGGLPGWTIGDARWVSNNGGASWFEARGPIPQITVEVNLLPPAVPTITAQPLPQRVFAGSNVSLSVTVIGNPFPTFQWRKDGVAVPSATNRNLTLNSVSANQAGNYTVIATNSAGSVTSQPALLDVNATAPAVANLGQPFLTTHTVGKGSAFEFQQAISFTTGPSIADLSSVALYGLGVGNVSGLTVTLHGGISAAGPSGLQATLVNSARPTLLANYNYSPSSPITLRENSTYWLVVSAPNTAAATSFAWRSTSALSEDSGGFYGWSIGDTRWVSTNGGASWLASGGPVPQFQVITTEPALAITAQPVGQTAVAGGNITLSVTVTGRPAPLIQWRKDGAALPGATAASLTLNTLSKGEAGSYSAVVSNSAGSLMSAAAIVNVIPASGFSNLSVRTTMAVDQVLIVGAVVSGGAKPILMRAAGPALNAFSLTGLVDPRLELFTTGSQPAATNDDWTSALAATFAAVGAFPFAAASKDAALSQLLNGSFTLQTRGTGSGAVLVEAYDVAGGTSSRLINFSVRNRAGTGPEILIAGFTLSGTGSKQVLIRAVGPGLMALGVSGTLADPRLEVLSSGGGVIGSNDDWDSGQSETFSRVGAFALPANSRDAALFIALDAGASYTVQVSGADGGSGEVLLEVYEIF